MLLYRHRSEIVSVTGAMPYVRWRQYYGPQCSVVHDYVLFVPVKGTLFLECTVIEPSGDREINLELN